MAQTSRSNVAVLNILPKPNDLMMAPFDIPILARRFNISRMFVKMFPNEVVELLINLPKTDNPVVYDGILDIALQLPIEYSVKLKDKILEYAGMEHQSPNTQISRKYWHNGQRRIRHLHALELAKILVTVCTRPAVRE